MEEYLAADKAVREKRADVHAVTAVPGFAGPSRALDKALRVLALDVTDRVLGFLACGVAFRWLTDWGALRLAVRGIALPGTLWVALGVVLGDDLREGGPNEKQTEDERFHCVLASFYRIKSRMWEAQSFWLNP